MINQCKVVVAGGIFGNHVTNKNSVRFCIGPDKSVEGGSVQQRQKGWFLLLIIIRFSQLLLEMQQQKRQDC